MDESRSHQGKYLKPLISKKKFKNKNNLTVTASIWDSILILEISTLGLCNSKMSRYFALLTLGWQSPGNGVLIKILHYHQTYFSTGTKAN